MDLQAVAWHGSSGKEPAFLYPDGKYTEEK